MSGMPSAQWSYTDATCACGWMLQDNTEIVNGNNEVHSISHWSLHFLLKYTTFELLASQLFTRQQHCDISLSAVYAAHDSQLTAAFHWLLKVLACAGTAPPRVLMMISLLRLENNLHCLAETMMRQKWSHFKFSWKLLSLPFLLLDGV